MSRGSLNRAREQVKSKGGNSCNGRRKRLHVLFKRTTPANAAAATDTAATDTATMTTAEDAEDSGKAHTAMIRFGPCWSAGTSIRPMRRRRGEPGSTPTTYPRIYVCRSPGAGDVPPARLGRREAGVCRLRGEGTWLGALAMALTTWNQEFGRGPGTSRSSRARNRTNVHLARLRRRRRRRGVKSENTTRRSAATRRHRSYWVAK